MASIRLERLAREDAANEIARAERLVVLLWNAGVLRDHRPGEEGPVEAGVGLAGPPELPRGCVEDAERAVAAAVEPPPA